jgi:hypothetical protein
MIPENTCKRLDAYPARAGTSLAREKQHTAFIFLQIFTNTQISYLLLQKNGV